MFILRCKDHDRRRINYAIARTSGHSVTQDSQKKEAFTKDTVPMKMDEKRGEFHFKELHILHGNLFEIDTRYCELPNLGKIFG